VIQTHEPGPSLKLDRAKRRVVRRRDGRYRLRTNLTESDLAKCAGGGLAWPVLLRKLDATDASFCS
jgi:hypothetical protein